MNATESALRLRNAADIIEIHGLDVIQVNTYLPSTEILINGATLPDATVDAVASEWSDSTPARTGDVATRQHRIHHGNLGSCVVKAVEYRAKETT